MMAVSASSGEGLCVRSKNVEIGKNVVRFGKIETFCLQKWRPGDFHEVNEVHVCTKGGMGLLGKEVAIEFSLETSERVAQFVKGLIENTKASFILHANDIEPMIVQTFTTLKGKILISFDRDSHCAQFNEVLAPLFFPRYERVIVDGSILELTLKKENLWEGAIVAIMNRALAALNQRTFGQPYYLLRNKDVRFFSCSLAPKIPPFLPHIPRYWVSSTKILKETQHRVPESKKLVYITRVKLPHQNKESIALLRSSADVVVKYFKEGFESSPAIQTFVKNIEAVLQGLSDDSEVETIRNWIDNTPELQGYTEPQLKKWAQIADIFNEKIGS